MVCQNKVHIGEFGVLLVSLTASFLRFGVLQTLSTSGYQKRDWKQQECVLVCAHVACSMPFSF